MQSAVIIIKLNKLADDRWLWSVVAMTTLIVLGSSVGSDDDNARVRPKKLWQDLTIWTTTRQVAAVVCRPELLLSFSWPPLRGKYAWHDFSMNIRQHPDPFRSQNHYVITPPLLGHLFGPPSPPAAAHLRQRLLGELKLIWPGSQTGGHGGNLFFSTDDFRGTPPHCQSLFTEQPLPCRGGSHCP